MYWRFAYHQSDFGGLVILVKEAIAACVRKQKVDVVGKTTKRTIKLLFRMSRLATQ